MASAQQLIGLVKSHAEGDEERFFDLAMQLAAAESQKGHTRLAEQLRQWAEVISGSKTKPVRVNGPVSIAGSNSHSVAAPSGCTIIPLALRQRLRRTRPFLVAAFEAMSRLGSSLWIRQD